MQIPEFIEIRNTSDQRRALLSPQADGGVEPVTLIAAWFAFTTGELWFLAGIEKAKAERR